MPLLDEAVETDGDMLVELERVDTGWSITVEDDEERFEAVDKVLSVESNMVYWVKVVEDDARLSSVVRPLSL